jgi:hypothetical protein
LYEKMKWLKNVDPWSCSFQYIKRAQAQSQQLSMPTSPRMSTPPWQIVASSQSSPTWRPHFRFQRRARRRGRRQRAANEGGKNGEKM